MISHRTLKPQRHSSSRRPVRSAAIHRTTHSPVPSATLAPKITLIIIALAFLAVIASLITSFILTPENTTKSTLSRLASSYYEDYYYQLLTTAHDDLDSIMNEYTKTGTARVTLRQLLLYSQSTDNHDASHAAKYCDENSTYVIFYPDPPYTSSSYHAEFTYSCTF